MYKNVRNFLTISIMLSLIIVGMFTSYITNQSFLEFQDSYIKSKESQIEYFFDQNFKDLEEIVDTNAVWTDAIEAMNRADEEWLSDNATEYLIENHNFDIDYIYVSREDEKFSKAYGFTASDKLRSINSYRDVLNDDKEVSLLIWDDDKLLLIHASPFYLNDMTSPEGVYMVARVLDEAYISSLSEVLSETDVKQITFSRERKYTIKDKYIHDSILTSYFIEGYDGDNVYLNVDFHISYLDQLFNRQSAILMAISSAIAIILLLVILYNLKLYTNKLGSVVEAIKDISNGHYQLKIKTQKSFFMPEMDKLIDSVNKMSSDVENHVKVIEKHGDVINNKYLEMVKLLVNIVEMNDSYTYHHSVSVSEYALIIGKAISFSDLENLELAAKLHDIGKIAIPTNILNKPGKLTDAEYGMIKTHSEEGYKLLSKIDIFDVAIEGVRYHHEKYNGFGYPDGLVGDNIPLIAQIISIADFYDALTSDRSYRKALKCSEAMEIIISEKGKALNPELVDVFYNEIKKLHECIEEN